jgi:hypothetical protein
MSLQEIFFLGMQAVSKKLTGDLIWKNPSEMQISLTTGMFIISKHYDRSNLSIQFNFIFLGGKAERIL